MGTAASHTPEPAATPQKAATPTPKKAGPSAAPKRPLVKYEPPMVHELPKDAIYDFVIEIDELTTVNQKGWKLRKSPKLNLSQFNTEDRVIVGVIGRFNNGKSWFLSRLTGNSNVFKSGQMCHTRGLSFKQGDLGPNEKFVSLDTEGQDTCVPPGKTREKRATESYLLELILALSSVVIVVVNRLKCSDQLYIERVAQSLIQSEAADKIKKKLFVVHNCMETESVKDVEEIIKSEVLEVYEAKQDSLPLSNGGKHEMARYWKSEMDTNLPGQQERMQIKHFVVAKDGSEAGKVFNAKTFDLIRQLISTNASDVLKKHAFNIQDRILENCQKLLPRYIDDNCTCNTPPCLHEKGGALVLKKCHSCSQGKVEEEKPEPLSLLPLTFDETGKANLVNPRDRPFCTLDEYQTSYVLRLSLAGCTKLKLHFTEKVISVTAERGKNDKFKETLSGERSQSLFNEIAFGKLTFTQAVNGLVDEKTPPEVHKEDGLISLRFAKRLTPVSLEMDL